MHVCVRVFIYKIDLAITVLGLATHSQHISNTLATQRSILPLPYLARRRVSTAMKSEYLATH